MIFRWLTNSYSCNTGSVHFGVPIRRRWKPVPGTKERDRQRRRLRHLGHAADVHQRIRSALSRQRHRRSKQLLSKPGKVSWSFLDVTAS